MIDIIEVYTAAREGVCADCDHIYACMQGDGTCETFEKETEAITKEWEEEEYTLDDYKGQQADMRHTSGE